jgi:serine/threonine kinase 33
VVRGGVTGESMLMTFCGTPVYMAPEVIQNHDYSQTCDIWSMGVIAYTLLSGKYPWVANQEQDLYKKIKKGIPKQDYDKKIFSAQAIDCISRMLEVNTAKRLTAAEVFNHPWTNGKQEMAPPNLFDVLKADAAKVRKEQLNLTPK